MYQTLVALESKFQFLLRGASGKVTTWFDRLMTQNNKSEFMTQNHDSDVIQTYESTNKSDFAGARE